MLLLPIKVMRTKHLATKARVIMLKRGTARPTTKSPTTRRTSTM
jgi:hypothetical protein